MADEQPQTGRGRRNRRVTRPAPPHSDATPADDWPELASEDDPRRWGDVPSDSEGSATGAQSENEQRLKRDKPPHWG